MCDTVQTPHKVAGKKMNCTWSTRSWVLRWASSLARLLRTKLPITGRHYEQNNIGCRTHWVSRFQGYPGVTGGYQGDPSVSGVYQGYPGNQGYAGYRGYQGYPGMMGGNQGGWPNMMGGSSGWPNMMGGPGW